MHFITYHQPTFAQQHPDKKGVCPLDSPISSNPNTEDNIASLG